MGGFPWPPLRLILVSLIVGLVAAYWLDVHTSVLIAVGILYGLLFFFG